MTFPHGPAHGAAPAATPKDERFIQGKCCGHFPNLHEEPKMRRPWGGSVQACRAWAPNDHKRCRCEDWRGADDLQAAKAKQATALRLHGVPFTRASA